LSLPILIIDLYILFDFSGFIPFYRETFLIATYFREFNG